MKTDAQIRAHVMRRVYVTYWVRQLTKPGSRLALTLVLLLGLTSVVSVSSVFANAPFVSGVSGVAAFFIAAFLSTTVAVQAMTVALLGSVGWLMTDALRKVFPLPAHARRVSP